jgi:hypothetical protein
LFWKELYEKEEAVFYDINKVIADDWAELQHSGINVDGVTVFPIILGIKADWSFHAP